MTVERGVDPRPFALMPFGGAGGLHATAIAEQLSIGRVLFPRLGGVLSAFGLAGAAPRRDASRSVLLTGERFSAALLERERIELIERAAGELGTSVARIRVRHELRYRGQAFELPIDEAAGPAGPTLGPDELRARFTAAHTARYGYRDDDAEIELVTLRAAVWGPAPRCVPRAHNARPAGAAPATVTVDGEARACTVLTGEQQPGARVTGPAVLALPEATLFVRPGWTGAVDEYGTLVLEHAGG